MIQSLMEAKDSFWVPPQSATSQLSQRLLVVFLIFTFGSAAAVDDGREPKRGRKVRRVDRSMS